MTSISRAAQKALTELEKSSADFEAQLVEAATFIGITVEEAAECALHAAETNKQVGGIGSHGKEEWLLKWLLKRLQAPKDNVPRQSAGTWNLLLVVLRRLPLNISARTLGERKIVAIIQQTLHEVKNSVPDKSVDGTGSSDNVEPEKKSKKRKRENTVVQETRNKDGSALTLLRSVLVVAEFIINPTLPEKEDGRGTGFATEYMRNVLRVKSEEAAKLLGTWLSLIQKHEVEFNDGLPWLSTFAEIWQLHQVDENHLAHFSLHCTLPLLTLRASLAAQSVLAISQSEQLIARNIVLPSKTAYLDNAESILFSDLTKLAVISDSLNALYLFEVAIRSLQPHGIKRRRPVDEAWLQVAFKTLIASLPRKRAEQNGKAICALLKAAIKYKVDIELETLKLITSEFALPETGDTNWQLVALMIKLDANVFLISSPDKDLLTELFTRISQSSLQSSQTYACAEIVSDVVVPLMGAFAMARDLTGFIHHWFAQLLIERKTGQKQKHTSFDGYRVWEDERIRTSLQTLLESSLSAQQLLQLLDWLAEKPAEDLAAVSVILQAISGAISQEEFVDAVGVRCYHIMFKDGQSQIVDEETVCRSWDVLSNTLKVGTPSIKLDIAQLWTAGAQPFDSLNKTSLQGLKSSKSKKIALALWKFACIACDVAKSESALELLAKDLLHTLIGYIEKDVNKIYGNLQEDFMLNVDQDDIKSKDAVVRFVVALVQALFVDHPKALVIAAKDPSFKDLLQIIFWLASAAKEGLILKNHLFGKSLSNSWLLALKQDVVLNDTLLTDMMIDILLDEVEQPKSQLFNSSSRDSLAVQTLLQLSTVTLHRKNRERIMRSWIPIRAEKSKSSREIKWTTPSILALKIKMMRFPMFYEGMEFKHLQNLREAVESLEGSDLATGLKLFGELTTLTLEFVFSNLEQARNQAYVKDAIKYINKANKSAKSDDIELSTGSIVLYNSILQSTSSHSTIILKNGLLNEKELAKFGGRLIGSLFEQAQSCIEQLKTSKTAQLELNLQLVTMLDALTNAGGSDVKSRFTAQCQALLESNDSEFSSLIRARLQLYLAANFSRTSEENAVRSLAVAEYSKIDGRNAIRQQVHSILETSQEGNRLDVLKTILLSDSDSGLTVGQLLAVREMILQLKDTPVSKSARRYESDDSDDSSDEDDGASDGFGLSEAYSILCGQLQKARGVRLFSLICETMVIMLKTKARSITQWNIDNTIGTIAIICSRHGPYLRSERAGTIYLHLCQLFQTVLLSHRLKLEGHFHLVVQALQALLRCLFVTLPHSSSKILRAYPSPPWLPATPSSKSLNASHAAAFTRLITLICDPTVSSVTRTKHNALTSATAKAKRMAGQHMVFVLMSYVRLQLDMKMLPGMRERMTPGLYAIFDTTTVELRRSVSEGMDASGRAVFGVLYRDYLKFGKWQGS